MADYRLTVQQYSCLAHFSDFDYTARGSIIQHAAMSVNSNTTQASAIVTTCHIPKDTNAYSKMESLAKLMYLAATPLEGRSPYRKNSLSTLNFQSCSAEL